MIPLKLTVRNFLSYRENVPALDFTGVHVACLCGDNGHGKSALLDAITWCLWGKARGQVQDDLVSYGADEARVELEFQARDSRFRAIRSRRRAGGRRRQGSGDLQLLALHDSGDGGQLVSGNSVRETQARIEHLVGMDYDTFINSAFLLQGRADEFTNRSPAERKAVLSSILGLEAYDRYQVKARERLAEKRREADRLAGIIEQAQAEIRALGSPAEELAGVNVLVADLNARSTEKRKEVDGVREEIARIYQARAQLEEQQNQASRILAEIDRVSAAIATAEDRVQGHRLLVSRAAEIEENFYQLDRARRQFATLEESRREHELLQAEARRWAGEIDLELARLDSEATRLSNQIDEELVPLVEAEPGLRAERDEARENLAALGVEERDLQGLRERLQAVSLSIGEAQTVAARYQAEGEQLNEKLHLLNDAGPSATCPLCLTPLTEDGCHRLTAAYQQEIEEKRDLFRSNRAHLQALEKQRVELVQGIPRREQEISRAGNALRDRISRLDSQIEASSWARRDLQQRRQELLELQAALESESYAGEQRMALADATRQLQELDYDEDTFRRTFEAIRDLEPYAQLRIRLDDSQSQLPADEAAVNQGRELLAERESELASIRAQAAEMEVSIAELPELEAACDREMRALEELESQRQAALGKRGMLEGEVQRLETLTAALAQNQAQLSEMREEQGIFQELVNAFGRQGIQAMLIETVVPRLEEETNTLLGRMTDNRMHVKLETQRERRTGAGEPIETLEINVSDELGTRNYEMYSGGEAFRVNLALRIALSRVLSQRTGAPLPTLFIDEGFGTQDASGRERIMDVISAIEDDFDKIIVITHLDDLKDMFPVRIEVQKDENGSTFWLS